MTLKSTLRAVYQDMDGSSVEGDNKVNTNSFTHDFTVHSQRLSLDSTCWVKGEQLSRPFSEALPANAADLLDLAMAIYAADRSSPRDFKGANTGQRRINVRIGLRNPNFWTAPETVEFLLQFLYWLSEDEWSFQFEERKMDQTPAESETFLFKYPLELPVSVSLFSGGLDSLAGLASQVMEDLRGSHILVSGYTHNRLVSKQRSQVQHIKSALEKISPDAGTRIWHVAVGFGMRRPQGYREERGQRTRTLVFLVLGAIATLQSGADTLWVYENGIGALNLPINDTQLGVDNYRGVHPRTLRMFEALATLALSYEIRVRNPFLFHTKAEMCRSLLPAGFGDAVGETISCDSFPMRIPDSPSHCGFCTSCVLRRQALYSAGLEPCGPTATYRYDVHTQRSELDKSQRYSVEAMRGQVHRLGQALASDDPWQPLIASFPELVRTSAELGPYDGLNEVQISAKLVRLFQSYVCEWQRFMPHAN